MSFSLTIGMTPMDNSSENVFFAFRYLVRYAHQLNFFEVEIELTSEISIRVRRIWAIGWSKCEKRLSQSAMSRPWPIAARA